MQTLSHDLPAVNPPVAAVDVIICAADFAAFCAALRSEFPGWGRSVQMMRKATHSGPVTRLAGLGGHTFSANDVTVIRAIAARYASAPVAPTLSWPQPTRRSIPAMRFARSTTWAGVR